MNIAIVGMGTVGGAAIRILDENAAELERKLGFKLHIRAAASLEVEKREEVDVPTGRRLLTRDWREAVEHPEADIVVEVVGGTTIAYEVQTTALALGRPGGYGEQGTARPAWRGAGAVGARQQDFATSGSQRWWRHPHPERAARGHRGGSSRSHLRHPQRHLQLHPHRD